MLQVSCLVPGHVTFLISSLKMAAVQSQPLIHKWPLGLCSCCSYKENDQCMWCPYFFPMGLLGTCFLVGKIRTLYVGEEKKCCCEMGYQGCALCLISTPINIFGPLGGFCWFAMNSMKMRHDISKKYNLAEQNTSLPSCCVGTSVCGNV